MGLETIRDAIDRKYWGELIEKTHIKLNKSGFTEIKFNTFKDDASYSKAKTGVTSTYWAFAKDSQRTWVELEIKPRTSDGVKTSQTKLYNFIKSEYDKTTSKIYKITWNDTDLISSPRRLTGQDIRIKIYLDSSAGSYLKDKDKWIDTMVKFIKILNPIIQRYK